jgi:hypothetical protein
MPSIAEAIVPDVARWGTNATNHTFAQWQARLASIRTGFFPTRHTALISHLRTRGFRLTRKTTTHTIFSRTGWLRFTACFPILRN